MPAAKKKAPAKKVSVGRSASKPTRPATTARAAGRTPTQRIHKPDVSKALLEDLIDGLHILAGHKVLDAYGHLSARSDRNPERFVMTRSRSPAIAEIGDVMEFDLESNAIGGDTRKPFLERFIHGQIYRARPDVMAIVHSHAVSVIPFGISSAKLRPVFHMGAFLHGGVPIFEIREPGGMTDMLITSNYLGKSLAGSLGACSCVLMRGHGYSTVGDSITEAVYRAIYTDVNAQVQLQAHSLGGAINFLEDEEGRIATDTIRKTMDRPWELWKLEVRKKK